MLSYVNGLSGNDFALGGLTAFSVLFIGYLLRLQFREIRKNRRMAEKGLRFGLVQEICVLKKPAMATTQTFTSPGWGSAIAPSRDTGAKIWTAPVNPSPPKAVLLNFQWN